MAGNLHVRKLDEELIAKLKRRAARHGRSTEAEHREILREALRHRGRGRSLKDLLLGMPPSGRDADFGRRSQRPRRVRL